MEDWKRDRIGTAERGENPTVVMRMPSGFAVMGDTQFPPGYCLLLGVPRVHDLSSLPLTTRVAFLRDMSLLGEAVEAVCYPQRVNYEIFGNTDPFLHAHVLPRYEWERAEYLRVPVSHYPRDVRLDPQHQFSAATHGPLQAQLASALREIMERAGVEVD